MIARDRFFEISGGDITEQHHLDISIGSQIPRTSSLLRALPNTHVLHRRISEILSRALTDVADVLTGHCTGEVRPKTLVEPTEKCGIRAKYTVGENTITDLMPAPISFKVTASDEEIAAARNFTRQTKIAEKRAKNRAKRRATVRG